MIQSASPAEFDGPGDRCHNTDGLASVIAFRGVKRQDRARISSQLQHRQTSHRRRLRKHRRLMAVEDRLQAARELQETVGSAVV
jgi:hypothetical protein